MKRLIIIAYILFFWLALPLTLFVSARRFDQWFNFFPLLKLRTIGIIIMPVMVFLLVLAIIQFALQTRELPVSSYPAKIIARSGLYSVFRHPIYLFFTLTLYSISMIWGSRSMLLIVMPLFVVGVAIYVYFEEKTLVKKFGRDYHAYQEQTGHVLPRFHVFLKIFFSLLSKLYFPIKVKSEENIPARAPFFLVANHRNYLDPFLISYTLPYKVHYVTTYEMFRRPITALIFRLLGCIPKKRYYHDIESVKQIIATIKNGGVVGIFPEGERSYTGELLELKPESLKLFIRFPDIPVVPVSVSGDYIMWPRWGKGWRRCPITIEYKSSLQVSKNQTLACIRDKITSSIRPDDSSRKTRHKKRAHDIQAILYRCPACRQFDCLQPAGNDFTCTNCAAMFHLNGEYRIEDKKNNRIMTINEFYEKIRITAMDVKNTRQAIATASNCQFYLEKGKIFNQTFSGQLTLFPDRIVIRNEAVEFAMELKNILSATIEGTKKLQVFDLEQKQAFQFIFPGESARKWQDFLAECYYLRFNKYPALR